MPDQKPILLAALTELEAQYERIVVRGVLVRDGDRLRPISTVFSAAATGDEFHGPQVHDYGEFVFVKDALTVKQLGTFVENLGDAETPLDVAGLQVLVPPGLFRHTEEGTQDRDDQMRLLQHSSSLDQSLARWLRETRSHPDSAYWSWPTRTFVFEHRQMTGSVTYDRMRAPLQLRQGLPVMPSLGDAMRWWLGILGARLEYYILFCLPDYAGRITEVKRMRNGFVVLLKSKKTKPTDLLVRYHLQHANGEVRAGDALAGADAKCHVPIRPDTRRAYLVLTSTQNPTRRLDYRDYDFDAWDRTGLDYVLDAEDVDFRIAGGENAITEFKLDLDDKAKDEFLETICSFSNSYGGLILIGVDNKGNVKGLSRADAHRVEDQIHKTVRFWLEPAPSYSTQLIAVRDNTILAVNVLKGGSPPYNFRDHGIYVRAAATDRIASRDEVLALRGIPVTP